MLYMVKCSCGACCLFVSMVPIGRCNAFLFLITVFAILELDFYSFYIKGIISRHGRPMNGIDTFWFSVWNAENREVD